MPPRAVWAVAPDGADARTDPMVVPNTTGEGQSVGERDAVVKHPPLPQAR